MFDTAGSVGYERTPAVVFTEVFGNSWELVHEVSADRHDLRAECGGRDDAVGATTIPSIETALIRSDAVRVCRGAERLSITSRRSD